MKKKFCLAAAAVFLALAGCGNPPEPSPPNAAADVEKAEDRVEKQLQVIIDHYEWPESIDSGAVQMYAVTDLDQNGRLEIISSTLQGTGRYTYSDYHEVNETLDGLTACETARREGDSQADIMVDRAPVYGDDENGVYYYIFNDVLKDGAHWYYENKRAVCLKDGKLCERSLAYKTTWYEENASVSPPAAVYEDADGNAIDEQAYNGIAGAAFPDFAAREARFFWLDIRDLDFTDDNARKDMLRKSYEGFALDEIT